MKLKEFIGVTGYINPEDHIKLILVEKNGHSKFPDDDDFIHLELNVLNAIKYCDHKVDEVAADAEGQFTVYIS